MAQGLDRCSTAGLGSQFQFCLVLFETVLQCNLGCHGTCYIDKTGVELIGDLPASAS